MPVTVVVGSQWGDEGKAKVIDHLAAAHTHVVRFQGGHNAGHTVVVGDQKYALQLIPSGVLYEHVTPVIANGVVVDLPTLFDEIDRLEARGVSCSRLKISSQAQLIFPWHQAADAIAEAGRGENKIGTTLKGIGPAYADKARRVGIRAGETLDKAKFLAKVKARAAEEQVVLSALGGDVLDVDAIVNQFDAYADRLRPYIVDTVGLLHDALESDCEVLLEGAQATFPTEALDHYGDAMVEIGHEFGTVTGRRRRPGWLDLVMLRHAVRLNSLTEWAITKLDVLDTFDVIKVCVAYKVNGKEINGYPDTIDALGEVEPVYIEIPGWKRSLAGVTRESDLPPSAIALIKLIEEHTKVPVTLVGTGPGRDDLLVRK